MIRRIVHMQFAPEHVEAFLELFHETAPSIRAFPGCNELTLLQETEHPGRMTTYSLWDDDDALQTYRNSDLFRTTWARTKVMFNGKPSAASYRILAHHA